MSKWYTHYVIYRTLTFDVEYKAESPIRVGSGKASKLTSPIDLPVLTIKIDGEDVPYIPGSSLKGVFRATAEQIARTHEIYACERGEGCREKYDKRLQQQLKIGDLNRILEILNEYCIICKCFGSGTFSSHIHFHDAYPIKGFSKELKTGIAIDRRSGTVKKGALYTIEYVSPGAIFLGKITLTNIPNYIAGLLGNVIQQINLGIVKIGGMKSRGFGSTSISIKNATGFIYEDNSIKMVKGEVTLKALDEFDEEVTLNSDKPMDYFIKSMEAWSKYVKSRKS
ncbi:MAG: CRISPR-associated RAMP protein Csx7 [Candidatus Methanomethylicia archaeon]